MNHLKSIVCICLVTVSFYTNAQEKYHFSPVTDVKTTSVKAQDRTGTCWAFSTISFIESEILRMGGPSLDLSEMFIVKHAYLDKAQKYVFLHGTGNFSQGGQAHDVLNVIDQYGMMRQSDYQGRLDTTQRYDHSEMESTLKIMIDNYVNQKNAVPSSIWFSNINSVLDNYMGAVPNEISYNKRTYTPKEFAEGLGVKKENYIELTSYSHHAYYQLFDLEVPDNWSHDLYYNVPLDELIETMKEALNKGYSIVWDGDVSDSTFVYKKGIARWPGINSDNQDEKVTQEKRQEAFLSWKATDDHLMHITGMALDQDGELYFKIKNSWGNTNLFNGYLYMSESYVRMNTVAIMLHKDALSKELTKKLLGNK